jgi:two-component system LytT family response regulator
MITALIVDDESHNRKFLRTLLTEHCPQVHTMDEAVNAEDAFAKIKRHKPALIFLDIRMRDRSGFSLLKMFSEINFEVIFVSAYDKYAIRAFEFNAVGYILKPIDIDKLKIAVGKASERIVGNEKNDLVLHFIQTLSEENNLINKFSLHHNGKVVFIHASEISFIEGKQENSLITLTNGSHYFSSKNLAQFETVLSETNNFIRINKGVIINTHDLRSYSKGDFCIIDMKSGQSFEVSRRRKTEILKKLKDL